MKKNALSLKSSFIMVGVLLATFLISMGCAYAYFTATASEKTASATTAIIKVGFSSDTEITVDSEAYTVSTTAYPGSTIKISGAVENTGTYSIYAILEFTITVDGEEFYQAYYTVDGKTKIVEEDGKYTTSATEMNVDNNEEFELSYSLDYTLDNSYMGKTIELSVIAHAIQTAYISSAVEAVNIMLGLG